MWVVDSERKKTEIYKLKMQKFRYMIFYFNKYSMLQ